MKTPTSYVCSMTPEQFAQLRDILVTQGWQFSDAPYTFWKATREKTSVAAFQSGKLTVQGKGTAELVQFVLEPQILKQARFGYEKELAVIENPEMFTPHAGIDESGKGDYFGPLVIAAAYVDHDLAQRFLEAGVADSKTIKNEKRIFQLEALIKAQAGDRASVVTIGPEAYNRLYRQFSNVNRLLAWGHARALENLLTHVPDCPRAISDQFGAKHLVERALLEKGRKLKLEQRHRAEADVAVAAASILARAEFVRRLEKLGAESGVHLPKGAGPAVDHAAVSVAAKGGLPLLRKTAKLHFRTTGKALPEFAPANNLNVNSDG